VTFAPVIPIGGYGGWRFLNRTLAAQQTAYAATATTQRDEAYFREKIASVKTADQLVADRRLLGVALGAFGLDGDIANRAFIRKVLEDGTIDPKALGNRLSDKRYLALSKAFGFGDFSVPNTQLSDFADTMLSRLRVQGFEAAVGTQNSDMRLALNARRELAELAVKTQSADSAWYNVMGSSALRKVFQKALGLPDSFAVLGLDQQLTMFRDRASATFGGGEVAQFSDAEKVEKLIRLFLLRSDAAGGTAASSGQSAALALLQAAAGRRG
jgi:Protein of unknown function (DUF1217)